MKTKKRKNSYSTQVNRASLHEILFESDSTYLLKLVLYVVLATLWLKFSEPLRIGGVAIHALPLGLLVGIVFVRLAEKHQIERKIMYATVVSIGILTYFVPAGIVI